TELAVALHGVECPGDDGERRTQLVRRVGGELSLHLEPVLYSVERLVDGIDERPDFGGQVLVSETDRHRVWSDLRCSARDVADRLQPAADNEDADAERGQHEQWAHPRDVENELPQEGGHDRIRPGGARDRY